MGYYERLGEILREKLASSEDPFADVAGAAAKKKAEPRGEREKARAQPEKRAAPKKRANPVPVPRELIEDFLVLGLRPGEPLEECKSAWKLLLKMHHPDKNQGGEDEKRIAEQTTINITRSYRRIKLWFETGYVPNE